MISDWTIYGYVGNGEVICPDCYRHRGLDEPFTRGDFRGDPDDDGTWHGLLSIADTGEDGLSCGDCGEYIFEPDPAYMHEQYGHADPVDGCELCAILEEQDADWQGEHESGLHADPVLGSRSVRHGWLEAFTRAGCPDCEREHAPAPGQEGLPWCLKCQRDTCLGDCVNPDPLGHPAGPGCDDECHAFEPTWQDGGTGIRRPTCTVCGHPRPCHPYDAGCTDCVNPDPLA